MQVPIPGPILLGECDPRVDHILDLVVVLVPTYPAKGLAEVALDRSQTPAGLPSSRLSDGIRWSGSTCIG